MGSYKMKEIRKRGKRSVTAGKDKAEFCQATQLDKYMARSSRSYKHPGYSDWCKKKNGGINVRGAGT
jgi:hypothetical protein